MTLVLDVHVDLKNELVGAYCSERRVGAAHHTRTCQDADLHRRVVLCPQ